MPPFSDIASIVGSVLLALGGGAVIVAALVKWLGHLVAERILERERVILSRETDLLMRRRDIYGKLSTSMRVFLEPDKSGDRSKAFCAAYDEASVWAPDSVMNTVGDLLDLVRQNTANRGSVTNERLQAAFEACVSAMRADSGFPNSSFRYRFVKFQQ
jgi:hypothetical protein